MKGAKRIRLLHQGLPETTIHLKNTYASETAATDGELVYVHFGYLGLPELTGGFVIAFVAQRERLEQMATLGRFSAQMAHDLKNPIAALKGAAPRSGKTTPWTPAASARCR